MSRLTDLPPLPAGEPSSVRHLDIGGDELAEIVSGDPAATVRRWRAAADRVVAHVQGPTFDPTAPTPLHAWAFDASTALVARAFEIWTHADDIRRAAGRPLDDPSPGELRTMSSISVGGLPALVAVIGGPAMQPTRVVLTGPGGGTFDLSPTVPGERGQRVENLLVADVVDYCRLAARRIDVADLAGQRDGDDEFIDTVLRAASAIAV